MSWNKIYALSLRHIYLIKGSFPRILDLIYWQTIQIFLWGFISKFFTLNSTYYENTVGIILSAAILYDFLFRSSISYNMMFLEEIWSRNFTNLFIAPIKIKEIIARIKKIFKLEKPKTFKVSKSLLFLIRAINHILEINIINGKISTIILGTCKLVRINGVRRFTSTFLKNSISSNNVKINPKQ